MPHTLTPVADMPDVTDYRARVAGRIAADINETARQYVVGRITAREFNIEINRLTQLAGDHRVAQLVRETLDR